MTVPGIFQACTKEVTKHTCMSLKLNCNESLSCMNTNEVHVRPLQQVCYKAQTACFMAEELCFIKALTVLMNNDKAEFSCTKTAYWMNVR